MIILSILAIITSLCSLWGCIEKTMDLQRQLNELKDSQITKSDLTVLGSDLKDIVNRGLPQMKNPPPPPPIATKKPIQEY